jgi:hypothetical protein
VRARRWLRLSISLDEEAAISNNILDDGQDTTLVLAHCLEEEATMLPIIQHHTLQKELDEAHKRLARRPGWPALEAVARCLHHLDDSSAPDRFRECANLYYVSPTSADDRIHMGNYYRLAGDHEHAQRWFHEAYTMYQQSLVSNPRNTLEIDGMIKACFLLGFSREVLEHAAFKRTIPGNYAPFSWWVEHLARSQVTNDPSQSVKVVTLLETILRDTTIHVSGTGSFTQWDLYEIAYRLASSADTERTTDAADSQ